MREGRAEAGGECLQGIAAPGTPAGFFSQTCAAWVAPEAERWIPADLWEKLRDGEGNFPSAAITIGGDGSRSYDTSALAWAQRGPDGRIDVACRKSSRCGRAYHTTYPGGGGRRLRSFAVLARRFPVGKDVDLLHRVKRLANE